MVAESAATLLAGAGRVSSKSHGVALLLPGDHLLAGLFAALRTDHAGEIGAVCLWQGVLRFACTSSLQAFAQILPALLGSRAVYATIGAVETFAVPHYDRQVCALALQPSRADLADQIWRDAFGLPWWVLARTLLWP